MKSIITMSDVTRAVIRNVSELSAEVCIGFGTFPQSCAPFNFNVTAYTNCAQSQTETFSGKYNILLCFNA